MARWKLFGRTKEEDTTQSEEETTEKPIESSEEEIETEDKPIAEYHETLETGKPSKSKTTTTVKTSTPSEQRIWRDVDSIEENVDNIHIRKAEKPVTDLEKKVDSLIEKRKKK
jgi:hypothetical protein